MYNLIAAADILGLKSDTLRKHLAKGTLRVEGVTKNGRSWQIDEEAMKKIIEIYYEGEDVKLRKAKKRLGKWHNPQEQSLLKPTPVKVDQVPSSGYITISKACIDNEEFNEELNPYSVKLMLQLLGQQEPDSEGLYECEEGYFADKGWKNVRIINTGIEQLVEQGYITLVEVTSENGVTFNKCTVNTSAPG
jgi:hypothetical protein